MVNMNILHVFGMQLPQREEFVILYKCLNTLISVEMQKYVVNRSCY